MDATELKYLLAQTQLTGLTINESAVARQWLSAHSAEFDSVDFQVRLGSSLALGPEYDDTTRRQAALLTQKRADIVARRGSEVWIVEVKGRVSLAAMGQLLGYEILWRAENPDTTVVHLAAIGYDALLDVHDVLAAHGIAVETYPNLALSFSAQPPQA